jgi:prevent-host-death family protein
MLDSNAKGAIAEHAVILAALDRCFLVPASLGAGRHAIQLRLTSARNGQRACINLARSFEYEGAIAQLGERRAGSAEAVGSSPTSSTSPLAPPTAIQTPAAVGAFPAAPKLPRPHVDIAGGPRNIGSQVFREQLGWWMDRVAAGEEIIVTRHGKPRLRLSPAEPIRIPP